MHISPHNGTILIRGRAQNGTCKLFLSHLLGSSIVHWLTWSELQEHTTLKMQILSYSWNQCHAFSSIFIRGKTWYLHLYNFNRNVFVRTLELLSRAACVSHMGCIALSDNNPSRPFEPRHVTCMACNRIIFTTTSWILLLLGLSTLRDNLYITFWPKLTSRKTIEHKHNRTQTAQEALGKIHKRTKLLWFDGV